MDSNKLKEGVSVREIEDFTKKHRFEVFFCLVFLFACIFSTTFFSHWWSVIGVSAGGIIGTLLSGKAEHFSKKIFQFVFRQDRVTQIVLGVAGVLLAIFLSPLVFLLIGLHAGKSMYHMAMEISSASQGSK
jgi:hypothetical protein